RLLVWAAGAGALAVFGLGPGRAALNPPLLTRGFGWLGDLLGAPAARWDAAWYLVIAHLGYRPDLGALTAPRTAFFPLYPLGIRSVSTFGVPLVALATATRSTGLRLALPALMLYLYGPREDRPPDARARERPPGRRGGRGAAGALACLAGLERLARLARPRYRVRADVLWLTL